MQSNRAKFLVVGCGFSGATVARVLAETTGERVLAIDERECLGGNAHDYRDANGIMIHKYGSHIFHTNSREVWNFITRFTGFNTYMHRVTALVDGVEMSLPFSLRSLHEVLPHSLAERLEKKLLDRFPYNSRVPILEFRKQEDADLQFLADYVYEKVFLGYTCKQWGVPPDQVDAAVTARVPVLISRDPRYFQDTYQGIPSAGYTETVRRMLDHPNIEVLLSTRYADIPEALTQYAHIFYTGAIDEFFDYSLGELPYRSVRLDEEVHERPFYQSMAVVNYPSNYDFTRIHEYKHYLGDSSARTVIAKEYPEAFKRGSNERFYPIPGETNARLYENYRRLAEQYPQVHFLGRLGDYKYYDMDKAVLRALQLVATLPDE